MKKKIIMLMAVFSMTILSCCILVACVPDRPDKFVPAWVVADSKAIEYGDMVVAYDKGDMMLKVGNAQTYWIKSNDKVEVYTTLDGEKWTYSMTTIEESKPDEPLFEVVINEEKAQEYYEKYYKKYTEFFEENFTKDNEGWWTAKEGLGVVKMKVEDNKLLTTALGVDLPNLIINYKVKLPDVAKNAIK